MDLRADLHRFLTDADARRDPRPLYDRLLREAPVVSLNDAGTVWFVSAHEAIVTIARTTSAVTDYAANGVALGSMFADADLLAKMLPLRAGDDHARLRRLATAAFSARSIASMRREIDAAVDALLSTHRDVGVENFDLVTALARPLPVAVSCAILDIPTGDRALVGQWAQEFVASMPVGADVASPLPQMRRYIIELCRQRRACPGDDLISELVAAHAVGTIDDEELFAFVVMLFVNGLDTLTSGLSAGVWHVLQHPGLLSSLVGDVRLSEAVFSESQRLASPVRASARLLTADITLDRHTLPAGSAAVLLFAAANRDPVRYPAPDRLDPHRAETRHLAFGHGTHHCLGAAISLIVGGTVLRRLAEWFPNVHTDITRDDPTWSTSLPFGGLAELPLDLTAPRRAILVEA